MNRSMNCARRAPRATTLAGLRDRLRIAQQRDFQEKLDEVDAELRPVRRRMGRSDRCRNAAEDGSRASVMARMNEILNRRSYIRNLVASVQKELAEA